MQSFRNVLVSMPAIFPDGTSADEARLRATLTTDTVRQKFVLGLSVAVALLMALGWLGYKAYSELLETRIATEHAREVHGQVQSLLTGLVNLETGQRGYLLTGEAPYLVPYESASQKLDRVLAQLIALTAGNPALQEMLARLQPLIQDRRSQLAKSVAFRRLQGPDVGVAFVKTGVGKATMDAIRNVLDDMNNLQSQRIASRQGAERKALERYALLALVLIAVTASLLAALYWLIRRESRARVRAMEALDYSQRMDRFYAEIMRSVSEGILVFDGDLRCVGSNGFFERMIGIKSGDVIGRSAADISPDMVAQGMREMMQRALSGETVVSQRMIGRIWGSNKILSEDASADHMNSASTTWTMSKYAPRRNRQGAIVGLICTVLDVSALARSQRELGALTSRLRELAAHIEEVREEERKRLAAEIHDEFGSLVAAIKANIMVALEGLSAHGPRASLRQLELAAQLAGEASKVSKRIVNELRPSALDHLGVWAAIEWQTTELTNRTGLSCIATIDEGLREIKIDADRASALFRIIQESLTNIVRHAKARTIQVLAVPDGNSVLIEIQDDGCGITEERLLNLDSHGIQGMHERARHFGGEVRIMGNPGQGTTVLLRVPFTHAS